MYKIYVKDQPIVLLGRSQPFNDEADNRRSWIRLPFRGNTKHLHAVVDNLEKSPKPMGFVLEGSDPETILHHFTRTFRPIHAAGGVVEYRPSSEIALIYRRGYWDLPKGKIDPDETEEQAAVREVREELGLQSVQLIHPICKTYHIYRDKDQRILKITQWYHMQTAEAELHPQTDEDIEKAVWVDPQIAISDYRPMYENIKEVLRLFIKKMHHT